MGDLHITVLPNYAFIVKFYFYYFKSFCSIGLGTFELFGLTKQPLPDVYTEFTRYVLDF